MEGDDPPDPSPRSRFGREARKSPFRGGHRAVSQVVVDSTSRAAILHRRSYTSKSRTLWSRAETEGHGQAAAMVKDLCIQIMMARGGMIDEGGH